MDTALFSHPGALSLDRTFTEGNKWGAAELGKSFEFEHDRVSRKIIQVQKSRAARHHEKSFERGNQRSYQSLLSNVYYATEYASPIYVPRSAPVAMGNQSFFPFNQRKVGTVVWEIARSA